MVIWIIADADLYKARKEYPIATVMLHKAIECLLLTAMYAISGFYCLTLFKKADAICGLVLWGVAKVFDK